MNRMEGIPKLSREQNERVEESIGGLEIPAKELLRQLSPEIERGAYRAVLGIDSSGRIPALILSGVIKNRYEVLGHDSPKTLFLAGGVDLSVEKLEEKQGAIREYIKTLLENGTLSRESKVLVVEDTTISGRSLRSITDALRAEEVPFDVAIFALNETVGVTREELADSVGTNIYGVSTFGDSSVAHKPSLSGVRKKHSEVFARPYNSRYRNRVMVGAREEAGRLIDGLSQWYVSSRKEASIPAEDKQV